MLSVRGLAAGWVEPGLPPDDPSPFQRLSPDTDLSPDLDLSQPSPTPSQKDPAHRRTPAGPKYPSDSCRPRTGLS